MMLEHLGEGRAAGEVMSAIESVTARGIGAIAGKHRTEEITQAVLSALSGKGGGQNNERIEG
jgi:tartrate dehydrogenase/decarboxylase/D-malate dehydrogenase